MFPPLRLREALTLGGLSVREFVARTWRTMNDHEVMTRASAVAFYAMLAAVPFLGIVLLLIVQLLPDLSRHVGANGMGDRTLGELEATLGELFPRDVTQIVKDQIVRIQQEPPVGLLSIGLLILLWSSSTLYTAIIDAMNRIAGVRERRSYVRIRLMATLMAVVEATILVGSLVAIVGWSWILRKLGVSSTPAQILATVALWIGLFVMVLLSFAVTFYIGPDAEQRWEWITPGSLFGTAGFLAGSLAFRFYIEKFTHYDKMYGSLGGVMVLMFWFWISCLVLLVAAQMNQVIEDASPLGRHYGHRVEPVIAPDLEHPEPEPLPPDADAPAGPHPTPGRVNDDLTRTSPVCRGAFEPSPATAQPYSVAGFGAVPDDGSRSPRSPRHRRYAPMADDDARIYERLLVIRCQVGDGAAFGELVESYGPRLRYYLRKMLGAAADVEDALQEVWLDVFRGLPRLVHPAAFPAWVYRVARVRAFRRLRRRLEPSQLIEDADVPDDENGDFSAEDAEQVHAALDGLAPEHREILVLRFLEEMPYEEIARVVGCRVGTVRSRLHYAKRALRRVLESENDHERERSGPVAPEARRDRPL